MHQNYTRFSVPLCWRWQAIDCARDGTAPYTIVGGYRQDDSQNVPKTHDSQILPKYFPFLVYFFDINYSNNKLISFFLYLKIKLELVAFKILQTVFFGFLYLIILFILIFANCFF